jgi:hypothetical protein
MSVMTQTPDTADPAVSEIKTALQITVTQDGPGLLVSLRPHGTYASEMLARRFYSIAELPAPEVTPELFWGTLLASIASFLAADDDQG